MRAVLLTLLIWTMAFTAIVTGSVLTYSWYKNRGPIIYITFTDAAGLIPNQSKIYYKGVKIGDINNVVVDTTTLQTVVEARLSHYIEGIIGEDSKFWLVKPEFSLGKASNLSALTSGNYVEVLPIEGKFSHKFIGLSESPVEPQFYGGLQIILKTCELGGVNMDSPILYLGLQIGEIREIRLAKNSREIEILTYIYKDYTKLVRQGSFFSNISGFHADISLFSGSQISMDSVRTLLIGGIELRTPNLGAAPAKNDDVFRLLTSEQEMKRQSS